MGSRDVAATRNRSAGSGLADQRVSIRILLAAFWICHFLLWTFGDMLTLLQGIGESITSDVILFVAPTTALVQALMVVTSLLARPVVARWANVIVTPVYFLFNIGFFVDATEGWEYYLGIGYVAMNLLILWFAYRWPKAE